MKKQTDDRALREWEDSVIEMFVATGDSIGLPRSLAQIYGLLYCSEVPLAMDDLMLRLGISKGSASQGLRQLSMLGAVRRQPIVGERMMHFTAERSLKRLGAMLLETQVQPRMRSGEERLHNIEKLIPPGEENRHARACTKSLLEWHGKARKIVPMLTMLLK